MIYVLAGDHAAYQDYCREQNLSVWHRGDSYFIHSLYQLRGIDRNADLRFGHRWEAGFLQDIDELAIYPAFLKYLTEDYSRINQLIKAIEEERRRRLAIVSRHDRYLSYLSICAAQGVLPPDLEEKMKEDPYEAIEEHTLPLERLQRSINWLTRFVEEKVQ